MVSSIFTILYHLILFLPLNFMRFVNFLLDKGCTSSIQMGSTSCTCLAYYLPLVLVGVFFITMVFVSNLSSVETSSLLFAPLVFKKIDKNYLGKKFICSYSIILLYIRSFFLKENPTFIYSVMSILFLIDIIKPNYITLFTITYLWVTLGSTLMIYDLICSQISEYILSTEGVWLSTSLSTTAKISSNVIKRHVAGKAFNAIFIGTTQMTATGRATLIAGTFTGGAWLFNSYLDRKATDVRLKEQQRHEAELAAKQQHHEAELAAKQHAYDFFKQEHAVWKNKRFGKGAEPKFEDYIDRFK